MTIGIETCLVIALAFAVFAAVTALGSSLVLGIGFERLRAGFEVVKSQTGFFSESIHKMDKRLGNVEKQGEYVFRTLHTLEESQSAGSTGKTEEKSAEPEQLLIHTTKPEEKPEASLVRAMWDSNAEDEIRFH